MSHADPISCSVIGLGKLGASIAAAVASRGHRVIGVDVLDASVRAINEGRAPVQETGLAELVAANAGRLRATLSVEEAVYESDISLVVVPTPSDRRGGFSLEYATAAFHAIGRALATKNGYHTVILCSTVLPGAMREGLLPVLEEASRKKCGPDFGLCYGPEFIALGSIIHDFLNPDFTLVGEFDKRSGDTLEEFYARVLENGAPCQRMSLENAELAKVALNSFVTTKITFANMLAQLCERLPGGDVDAVTGALGLDARIGSRYLKGGLGYGGPCFPRDNIALSFLARSLGIEPEVPEATDRANRRLSAEIANRLESDLELGDRVTVLGLAYKPDTHVVEESPGVAIATALAQAGHTVTAYDPLASGDLVGGRVHVAATLEDALDDADVVLITTPDPAFTSLDADALIGSSGLVTLIDFWRIIAKEVIADERIRYRAIGRGTEDPADVARLRGLWAVDQARFVLFPGPPGVL
jgi:UDPglucose 6-dehydrogenase